MDEDVFYLVGLLYPDADANTVDAGLYENLLVFISGDSQRIEEDFGGCCSFDFGDVVPF